MIALPQSVTSTELNGVIEQGRWLHNGEAALEVSGWVFLQHQSPWSRIDALAGAETVATTAPRSRPDVATAHSANAAAGASGFCLSLPLLKTDSPVRLVLIDAAGDQTFFWQFQPHELPGRAAVITDYAVWSNRRQALLHRADFPPPSTPQGFSVIIPIYQPNLDELSECLLSLQHQWHPQWQAWLIEDGAASSTVSALLRSFAAKDPRFRILTSPTNEGIAAATNRGIAAATDDWLVFLDQDDRLLPPAFAAIDHTIRHSPHLDVVYSDEEKITAGGEPCLPCFKPDWSPEFFRGVMFVGHLLCARTALARRVGGPDPRFNGIQDFEMLLRWSEHTEAIQHLPACLYQWRLSAQSSALAGNVKGDMDSLQVKAVAAHLARIGRAGHAVARGAHRVTIEPPATFVSPPYRDLTGLVDLRPVAPADSWVVFKAHADIALSDRDRRRLLFHATENPDRIYAPVLHSADGLVAESGCTWTADGTWVRLMRGFDPDGDGYLGSLSCHREVGAVSGEVLVMHRALWNRCVDRLRPEPPSLLHMAEILRSSVSGCVVIANAIGRLPTSLTETPAKFDGQAVSVHDHYWNSAFDPAFGDYRLHPISDFSQ